MNYIKSPSNQIIKEIHSLHTKKGRDKTGCFLLEGAKILLDAINNDLKVNYVAYKEGYVPDQKVLKCIDNIYECSEAAFKKASSTDSPGNILAVLNKFTCNAEDIINVKKQNKLFVILDQLQDPGNIGNIIRTCTAANIDGIFITDLTVDLFNPKVVRSSAGTLWKIPIAYKNNKQELITLLKNSNIKIFTTQMMADKSYHDMNYNNDIAIAFGSEAKGLSGDILKACDYTIKIPISENVESLNVANSVAIILFEAIRQKGLQ